MKYCLNYNRNSEMLSEVDEINVKFSSNDMDALLDFLIDHPHQRINIRLKDINDVFDYNLIQQFQSFQLSNPEVKFAFLLPKYDLDVAKMLQKENISYFFNIVIRDWETFYHFLTLGVSDIYLVEQMMFEIKDAAAAAHQKGVKIRTFPNIAQQHYESFSPLKSFFIRPEDISLYEGLVDIMEIYTVEEIDPDVVLDIYKNDKMWFGPLKEIIMGLVSDIDGKYIIPRFGERRLSCNRKCFKGKSCDVCDVVLSLSEKLETAGIVIRNKNKEESKNGEGSSSKE